MKGCKNDKLQIKEALMEKKKTEKEIKYNSLIRKKKLNIKGILRARSGFFYMSDTYMALSPIPLKTNQVR